MTKTFEEDYKKIILNKIKDSIIKYDSEYQNNGIVEYIGNNISCEKKALKIIASIWAILFFLVLSIIIYKEGLVVELQLM